ncbi:MAG: AAA family ATPase [Chloroflexota bacterium]
MIFLRTLNPKASLSSQAGFPFQLPIFQSLQSVEFSTSVTFFVGENGSGKSTLLEAIAAGMGSTAIGSQAVHQDNTLMPARRLAQHLRFVRNQQPKYGFFFRAEDMFGFTKSINQAQAELNDLEQMYNETLSGYGRELAVGSMRGQRKALSGKYGEDADAQSHGEAFLSVFQARMVPKGLYLLDEPETPLSPIRQLALLSILKDMVTKECQFIIATHSPILMAFPEATILNFDEHTITPIAYDDVEHVSITRAFLNNPAMFLQRL